ncbi:MAG: sugar ABC transporter substrate-binding protein [Treponema sp.]|jgi:multiple sugar transport system substrate-binding protein|nr:sugar ABC transporter substrate-binding protein [Treponema sp.]
MKKLALITLFLVLPVILFAEGSAESKAKKDFTFGTWASGGELREFQAVIDRVNAAAAGKYKIRLMSYPIDYEIRIGGLVAAQKAPDFFWLSQEHISKYALMGAIVDITDSISASTVLKPERFYPGVLNSARYNGRYYGLPWIANTTVVYYNKALFDEAGIPYPNPKGGWTWDQFIETAKKLTKVRVDAQGNPFNQYGYIVDGWPNIETFIWAGGGDIVAANSRDLLLDESGAVKGIEILQKIIASGISPRRVEVGSNRMVWFANQRVAMYMAGIADNIENTNFPIGYAPLPVGLDGKSWNFNWTASTVLNAALKDNPLAYEAMEAITLEIFKWKVAPPILDMVDQIPRINPRKAGAMETIHAALEGARSANYIPAWNEINGRLWNRIYERVLNNESFDIRSELQAIANECRQIINNQR